MTAFPPLTHVALTVRDLSVSRTWYEALLDAEPVLDEDTDPDGIALEFFAPPS